MRRFYVAVLCTVRTCKSGLFEFPERSPIRTQRLQYFYVDNFERDDEYAINIFLIKDKLQFSKN